MSEINLLNCGEFNIVNLDSLSNAEKYKTIFLFKKENFVCKRENNRFIWKIPKNQQTISTFSFENFKGKLFDYQKYDAEQLINRNRALLLHETGTGKTIITLASLSEIIKNDDKVLLVVPKSIILQWMKEIQKNTNFTFCDYRKNFRKFKEKMSLENYVDFENATIQIITYARLRNTDFSKTKYKVIIFDEASLLKSLRSKQHQEASKIFAEYKWLLTATPIKNKPSDAFALCQILDIEQFLFGHYGDFINNYAIKEKVPFATFPIITGWRRIDEVANKINKISFYRAKTDVAEYLKMIMDYNLQTRYIDPSVEQLRLSRQIENKTTDENALALFLMDLLQADSPKLLYQSESETRKSLDIPEDFGKMLGGKIEEMYEILQENEGKTVIFTNYTKMAKIIQDFLNNKKIKNILISGETKNNEENIEIFKNDETINVLIATNTMKYGVNLQEAQNIIMFDLPFSYAEYEQIIGRVVRIGQNKIVNVFKLIMLNSFEVRVDEILNDKKDINFLFKIKNKNVIE